MPKKKQVEEPKEDINLDSIKNELTEYIDQKIKLNLNNTVDEKIKKEVFGEIDRANRRLIREKNKKIFNRNITIIILLALIGFLVYILYDGDYFDKYFDKKEDSVSVKEESSKEKESIPVEEVKEKNTLDDLKEKYSYLIDDIYINEDSDYLEDYYNGNLTNSLKNYLALNLVSQIEEDEDYNIIESSSLKKAYNKMFDSTYQDSNFKYNGINVKYVSKMESYITSSIIDRKDTNIKREIINIEEKNNEVKITTIEAKVIDGNVYNILTNEKLGNKNVSDYKDKLNQITYIFKDAKLVSINK